jgi:beta-glucosidase
MASRWALPLEEVGFSFNRQVITNLLREKYGFDGVVCTDWGLLTDTVFPGSAVWEARAWGVEHLSLEERAQKALEAGVDQFGGEACPEVIVALVRAGKVSEARIDQSIRRILRDTFRLGMFDNPYLDVDAAEKIAGSPAFREAGDLAQRKSIVLLKNGREGQTLLPLHGRLRIYVEGMDAQVVSQYAEVVAEPAAAELAILRLNTPHQQREGNFLERMFHAGDLDFKDPEKARILRILEQVPTIVQISLDRPAVMPEIAAGCAGLLADFGASDAAVLDVLFGRFKPSGKLPFELPSSMDAVRAQKEDLPHDSENPLYPFGFGLRYETAADS